MAATPSASSDGPPLRDLVLPASLRARLAAPLGPVRDTKTAHAALRAAGRFASCGDVVTGDALAAGLTPFLAVIDGKTLRESPRDPRALETAYGPRRRTAHNPAGRLTAELQRAVREMVRSGGGLLWVDGEEDLAALPLILEMPLGTTVIYGQPGAGVCLVTVDAESKDRARSILNAMETPHGHQDH